MLLFQKAFHEGLVSGRVTLTFRRWARPHVKIGGRYRCHPIGVLEVHEVARTAVADIGPPDAAAAGFETLAALLEYMAGASDQPLLETTEVWRVALRYAGDGDRVTVAMEDQLGADDIAVLEQKVARLDAGAAWTKATLAAIDAAPRVAASKLAIQLGRDRDELKIDIRKLKRLGLTQSFEVGYEVSPRGRAFILATASIGDPKKVDATPVATRKPVAMKKTEVGTPKPRKVGAPKQIRVATPKQVNVGRKATGATCPPPTAHRKRGGSSK